MDKPVRPDVQALPSVQAETSARQSNGNALVARIPVALPAVVDQGRRLTESRTMTLWKRPLKIGLLSAASLAGLVSAIWCGTEYLTVWRFQISTDDAYVKADTTTIAPKISGYLTEVLVGDNQPVKAGQVLARIDPRDFRVALNQAMGGTSAAFATLDDKKARLHTQQSIIEAARATIAVDKARVIFAEQDARRYAELAADGWGPVQKAQETSSQIAAARAVVTHDIAALATANDQTEILRAEVAQAAAALEQAKAVQEQADLNLSYTSITAPNDGVIGNRTLRVGQYIQAGTQLMSLVPAADVYVVANYKETQLTDVREGQPVSISVDTFSDRTFSGHVESIAPASGQEFALLPPDNATGNFTKVVQRVPVKIVLDRRYSEAAVLRPGMSVVASVDTRPGATTPSRSNRN
jgi:membrane fusion protein (multidrug efflux system)